MERTFSNLFGLLGQKEVPQGSGVFTAMEETREGLPKSYIPNFMWKPPFGYPRYKDLSLYRQLSGSVYVDMCETAIIDVVCSTPWEIVAEDESGNELPGKDAEREHVHSFFMNPNTNNESWEMVTRMMLPDLIELNSGVMVKVFNSFGEMVEIVARDGAAFTKNPDPYGFYTDRADIILVKDILTERENKPKADFPLLQGALTPTEAQQEAAYFQYGWNSATKPIPFGRREVVWFEKKVRTDNLYGRSSMEILHKTVQTLIYAVEHNLEYFSDNSIPPGVLGLDGLNTSDMKAFANQWIQSQKKRDSLGSWKKAFHKMPMVNKMPKFERIGYTNQELQIIEQQQWWAKLVWAALGMTATELGFTEEAKGNANQIVQTDAVKRRIVYPLLRLMEYVINTQIVAEFGYKGIKFKYKIFDVDTEMKKYSLYELQAGSGLKTINEIRNSEGLDPVEWGDQAPNSWSSNQGMNINMTDPRQRDENQTNNRAQRERDQALNRDEEKSVETNKAVTTDDSLTLGPHERMAATKLEKEIIDLLKQNEKAIIDLLNAQGKSEPLKQIKSVEDLPDVIKDNFQLFTTKGASDVAVRISFDEGWEKSEKQINKNVPYNKRAVEFLQDHTFDIIKGMTEEIATDLKQELERGIINAEGVTKLKERVKKVFDVGENRARMIARTELNRASNNGKLLAIKESGLKYKKKVITAHDDRTSALCKRLDGQTVDMDGKFSDAQTGGEWTAPPFHVNCRSTLLFEPVDE